MRNVFLRSLVDSLYTRNEIELNRGNFRVKGETVDIFPAYADHIIRVVFWGDEIDEKMTIEPVNMKVLAHFDAYKIYPASIFVTTKERIAAAISQIENDLAAHVEYFNSIGKHYEAKRIYERVNYDLEMIKELGYCSGVENYSRYYDGRPPLFPGSLPDDYRRKPRNNTTNTGYVWWRCRPQTQPGGVWFPATGSQRQPPAAI